MKSSLGKSTLDHQEITGNIYRNDNQSSNIRSSLEGNTAAFQGISRSPRDLINNPNVTQTSFDFNPLGEDKQKKISLYKDDKETIDSSDQIKNFFNRERKPKSREKLFIVNKKPKTTAINQKSCFSKQTILLSHGDQYREIYEFTRKINESLRSNG